MIRSSFMKAALSGIPKRLNRIERRKDGMHKRIKG
jgi:hypothetical protein